MSATYLLCQGADVHGRPMEPDDDPEDPTFTRCPLALTIRTHTLYPHNAALRAAIEAEGWTWTPLDQDGYPVAWCPRHS